MRRVFSIFLRPAALRGVWMGLFLSFLLAAPSYAGSELYSYRTLTPMYPSYGSKLVPSGPKVVKSVAILPLENLTDNPEADEIIRDYIKQELKGKGWVLVARDADIERFLAKRRIRYTGAITRLAVREMGKKLGVDAVVVGSVLYYTKMRDKIIVGVGLRVLSTADGSILWAENLTYTGHDFEGLFGLGVVKSLDVLAGIVVRDIVRSMADRFFIRDSAMSPFEIERVILEPPIGRGPEKREIRVKFLPLGGEPEKVRAVVDGKTYFLSRYSDEYRGYVYVPEAEGTYIVSLVVTDEKGESYFFDAVAEATVDNTPPRVEMYATKKVFSTRDKRNGYVLFETKVLSIDNIDGWRVEIRDEEGKLIKMEHGYGAIPPKFIWRGEAEEGWLVRDGKYSFNLVVVDNAGNETLVARKVRVKTTPPRINVSVDMVEGIILFNFESAELEEIKSWSLTILDKDGKMLKTVSGEKGRLPEKIEYPVGDDVDIRDLKFILYATDVAGNKLELKKSVPSVFTKKMPFAKLKGKADVWEDF